MSIKKKSNDAVKALQDTLKACPHIEEIHFADNGDHYFAVHEFKPKDAKKANQYGRLKSEPVLKQVQGTREIFKIEPVDTPETKIVETLSRDEVLGIKVDDETLSKKDQKIVDKLQAELEAAKAKLKGAGIE